MNTETEYYSQYGQDIYIDTIFEGERDGVFLDIGAHDGIQCNNTYFFEKNRNWRGLCVEANPIVFEKLKQNRSCDIVNACISDQKKKDVFMRLSGYTEMLSGLISQFNSQHIERIKKELDIFGGKAENIEIECITFNSLIGQYNLNHIDYCSIDIEGGELTMLKTIDFSILDITAFSIENTYGNKELQLLLKNNGYTLVTNIMDDEIYIKSSEIEV